MLVQTLERITARPCSRPSPTLSTDLMIAAQIRVLSPAAERVLRQTAEPWVITGAT